jgi:succinate dehydrogenase/fumarate reductase flavoprotein subunit
VVADGEEAREGRVNARQGVGDDGYDVVVAGLGFAGAMAALAAHDAGARVAVFEKGDRFGGVSILSGGGCVGGTDFERCLAYLKRTCLGTTPDDVLEAFARGMAQLPAAMKAFAAEVGFDTITTPTPARYPFPGAEQLVVTYVTRNEHYPGFPFLRGERAGATLFWVIAQQLARRPGIEVFYETPVRELVIDEAGGVTGVVVETPGGRRSVAARRGVVLATGGFEHDREMLRQHLPLPEVSAIGPTTHTGDGVRMAQKAGAGLWHMWLVHGSYGFHVPGLPVAVRHTFDAYQDPTRPMPWIALDQAGRRFMNEYPPAVQDTPIRPLEYYDADLQAFPRVPCYLVFDEEGRALGPIGRTVASSSAIEFTWSQDNLREIESGLIRRAGTLAELAERIGVEPELLQASVDEWNRGCEGSGDPQFHRPLGTMMPIRTPPYYAVPAWPLISNTQGGPVHDPQQRVVDSFGQPIPGLFAAGELGSIFGHLYLLGGNLSECFIGGQTAGREAAERPKG